MFNQYGYYPNYNYDTQTNQYYFVDGIEGARAFQSKPNTMVLLMDSQNPICYKKQTDFYGKTVSLEVFDLVPHEDKKVEYATKEDLEEIRALLKKDE